MRPKDGHDIKLGGRPAGSILELPEPEALYLPLRSRRFAFSEQLVKDGERVIGAITVGVDVDAFEGR